ncbi:MAG TPA: hypothetical protein VGF59_28785 [Bryobacteraceae bacterium]|jgi:hypothetical protein
MKISLLAVLAAGLAAGQTPDVASIMSRVAVNQAKSQEDREQWVYTQKQLLRFIRGGGKLAREERREYTVAPQYRGIKKSLVHFEGKYADHGKEFAYDKPRYEYKSLDIDGQLIDELSNDMLSDRQGRDGIDREMFPLTYHEQLKYDFKFVKTEKYHGRDVYRVAFEPKPHVGGEEDGPIWKGEALIDAEEFQPVAVNTKMAKGLPLLVKTLLGTNIKGLGFSVTYDKFDDGVWFPVSYGGEFEVRAVFVYKRTMTISMQNVDFRRTDVKSEVAYETDRK